MNYPTKDQVKEASHIQLAKWYRFLPSPGSSAINNKKLDFNDELSKEAEIMNLIVKEFQAKGGMTSHISKTIGW